MTIDLDIKRCV